MKVKKWSLILVAVLCWMAVPTFASSLGDIRVNARFLTDRMAFELNLNNVQYNDLFEINYDFLYNVDPYIDRLAYSDPYALDCYYRYLDERNDDLRWVLSSLAYARFMALDYFFRPVYALNHVCHLRIYQRYPNHDFFYFGRPRHYLTYRGAHSRLHCGGISFYRKNYAKHYHHPVYAGHFRSRPDFRKHDFVGPRPSKGGNGFHFTPVHGPRPGASAVKPGKGRLDADRTRPGMGDRRPEVHRPASGGKRPADKGRPSPYTRPSSTQDRGNRRESVRPSRGGEKKVRQAVRPSQKEKRRENKQSGRAFLRNM